MNKLQLITIFILLGLSCSDPSGSTPQKVRIHQTQEILIDDIVDPKLSEESISIWEDKTIGTKEYPLFLALYRDNIFFYEIPGLGEGKGRWKIDGRTFKLQADTSRFEMIFTIYNFEDVYFITFSDKNGKQTYELEFFE